MTKNPELTKNDGYIKNQNIRLKKIRYEILVKIAVVVIPSLLLVVFFAALLFSTPSPEKWQQKDITFSDISREYFIKRSSYFFNTTDDGQFILPLSTKEIESLSEQLIPGHQYTIIYTKNIFTKIAKSLHSESSEFIKLEDSITEWEKSRHIFYVFAVIIILFMFIGSVLVYILWCKKERQQIVKIKSKIDERVRKKSNS